MDTENSAVALGRYLQCSVVSSNDRSIEAHISNIKKLNKDMSMFNLEPCSKTILKALQFQSAQKTWSTCLFWTVIQARSYVDWLRVVSCA